MSRLPFFPETSLELRGVQSEMKDSVGRQCRAVRLESGAVLWVESGTDPQYLPRLITALTC